MMILAVIFLYCLQLFSSTDAQGTYRAAVVEYAPVKNTYDVATTVIKNNVKKYIEFIEEARTKGAQIIVFPEDGLTTLDATNLLPEHLLSSSVPTINISALPCTAEDQNSEVLRNLSCAAQKGIYVVVNLVERQTKDNKTLYFNTNVVFDNKGKIIAKYRKMNLYYEPGFTPGSEPVTFKTDFGVTFGMFICFDILFKNSSVDVLKNPNVTDIIYSTAWFSETPYLSALSVQAGYARGHGVNLLAAGYNNPAGKNGGSGIYLADGSIAEAYVSGNKASKLIIQDVPIISKRTPPTDCNRPVVEKTNSVISEASENFSTYRENFTDYTLVPLSNNSLTTEEKVCSGKFCCSFNITVSDMNRTENNYNYRMAVFRGVRRAGLLLIGTRYCGLIACTSNESLSCGSRSASLVPVAFKSISITGDNWEYKDDITVFPATVQTDLSLIANYSFCVPLDGDTNGKIIMSVKESNKVLGFGFYGRLFSLDGYPAGVYNRGDAEGSNIIVIIIIVVIVLIAIGAALVIYRRTRKYQPVSK